MELRAYNKTYFNFRFTQNKGSKIGEVVCSYIWSSYLITDSHADTAKVASRRHF